MSASLHELFHAIAIARNEFELRLCVMDAIGEYFGVPRWGIYLFNESPSLAAIDVCGMRQVEAFVESYETFGREVDPVLKYVMKRHAPAHEEMVLPPGGWKQCELYQRCCAYYDHEHIMTGPIVGNGSLIGAIHFARLMGQPAFNTENIIDLSALCTHFSARLAMMRSHPQPFSPEVNRLTQRELQIAQLVAQGLTNAEIGTQLWITQNSVKQALKRMFRKLNVSARAELVARLHDSQIFSD